MSVDRGAKQLAAILVDEAKSLDPHDNVMV
jgi:hypothetical protein